jgi:excisionase family DNA binding protein
MRRELEAALKLARELPASELPDFLGSLETIRVIGLARITTPAVEARPDELLTVGEVSKRMHVSKDFVYTRGRRWPFCRPQGRKLLFSSNGLDNYLRRARA